MATPRGIANKNPGNLVMSGKEWPHEVPHSRNTDGKFMQFDSMQHGIEALMLNLLYYFKSGRNTVKKILDRWNPPPEDNSNYVVFVSHKTGFSPNQVLVPDRHTIIRLTRAIIDYENGHNTVSNITIHHAYAELHHKVKHHHTQDGNYTLILPAVLLIGYLVLNND